MKSHTDTPMVAALYVERGGVYIAQLAPLYLGMEPADRREVVLEVLCGERCEHGFPEQGEGCRVCSGTGLAEWQREIAEIATEERPGA